MKASTFSYDSRPSGGKFQVMAVKYTPERPRDNGVTLILAHGNAMHKETWSTMISFLFNLTDSDERRLSVREAWAIECPNHGESAVLNEADIATHYPAGNWNGWEYPNAMLAFLRSCPGGTNFYEQNLVGVGHSNGGSAVVLLDSLDPHLFTSFILLDPAISRLEDTPARAKMERIITPYTWTRQDTWRNRKAARKVLEVQEGSRYWHPQVMDAYVEKALRVHPAAKLPDPFTFNGVTLACTRAYESAMTRSIELYPYAFELLQRLYRNEKQVHLIIATLDKFGVKSIEDAIIAPEPVLGRKANSFQRIARGGHMFVQTEPEAAANAVHNAIRSTIEHQRVVAKKIIPSHLRLPTGPLRAHL